MVRLTLHVVLRDGPLRDEIFPSFAEVGGAALRVVALVDPELDCSHEASWPALGGAGGQRLVALERLRGHGHPVFPLRPSFLPPRRGIVGGLEGLHEGRVVVDAGHLDVAEGYDDEVEGS